MKSGLLLWWNYGRGLIRALKELVLFIVFLYDSPPFKAGYPYFNTAL
jgi:hypothetical protein